jgi:hypothetical protein
VPRTGRCQRPPPMLKHRRAYQRSTQREPRACYRVNAIVGPQEHCSRPRPPHNGLRPPGSPDSSGLCSSVGVRSTASGRPRRGTWWRSRDRRRKRQTSSSALCASSGRTDRKRGGSRRSQTNLRRAAGLPTVSSRFSWSWSPRACSCRWTAATSRSTVTGIRDRHPNSSGRLSAARVRSPRPNSRRRFFLGSRVMPGRSETRRF